MADGAGPSDNKGRRKFAPTVPSRRKKQDEAASEFTAADAAAANEAFSDLIRAAQTESKWQRGRGRGFGRGRGGSAQQVTFGGGDESNVRPIAGTRAAPTGRLQGLRGDSSSSGVKHEAKPGKAKGDPGKPAAGDDGRSSRSYEAGSSGLPYDDEADEPPSASFDLSQYFPSSLPMPRLHPLDSDIDDEAALMRSGVPQDLVLLQDEPEHTAQQLGLSDLSAAQDTLFLFKLPSALPFAAPAIKQEPDDKAHRRSKAAAQQQAAAAAAAAAATAAAGGASRAASIRELPSGRMGKLLIFKSGKVKLQIGEVLLDVTAGMPCISRQDVVALNSHSKVLVQLGSVTQRAVVCPDVWQLMADGEVPQFSRAPGVAAAGRGGSLAAAADEDGLEDGTEDGMAVDGVVVNGAAADGEGEEEAGADSSEGGDAMEVDGAPAAAAAGRKQRQERQRVQNGGAAAAAAGPSAASEGEEEEQEVGSSSEEADGDDDAAAVAADAAAKQAAEKQRQQQQQAVPPDPLMGVLGLPSSRAGPAAAGAGAGSSLSPLALAAANRMRAATR